MKTLHSSLAAGAALIFSLMSAAAADLKIGVFASPLSMDPHFSTSTQPLGYETMIYEPLVKLGDKDSAPEPWLARSWKHVDDTTWEFALRTDVRFHDGSPFTAADAAFSIMRAKTLKASPLNFGVLLRLVKAVEVVDDHTIRVITDGPAPALLDSLGLVLMVSKKAADGAKPEDFNTGKAALGTGPYKFTAWRPNDVMSGEKNPNYWGQAADWDHMTLQTMSNDAARIAAVTAGDIDAAEAVPPQDVARIKSNPKLALDSVISSRIVYVAMDTGAEALDTGQVTGPNGEKLDRNPLADPRIREAMKLALNLDSFVDRIYQGSAKATGQFFLPGTFNYKPGIAPWKADEAKAKALVAESGWANKFKIALAVPGAYFARAVPAAEGIAQTWSRIGIPTSVNNMPYPVFIEGRSARKLPVYLQTLSTLGQKAEFFWLATFHSRAPDKGFGTLNFFRYANPEVDRLVERSFATLDENEQQQTRWQAQDIVLRDNAIIPLWFLSSDTAVRAGIDFVARPDTLLLPANLRVKR